ncbi:MAG: 2'-5' RNA ligase family protein [Flavobacteriales bacterium]|nr:2'-5' RNA ligase family protein [Flavobacteriales bacterium]
MSPEENLRLFLGTLVPREICATIREAAAPHLRDRAWRAAPERQWHVTALFVGQRSAADLEVIRDAAIRIAASTALLNLHNGVLCTMGQERPTMMWLRFPPHAGLTQLHHALARSTGTTPVPWPVYTPHVTIARSKGSPNAFVETRITVPELALAELTLFRSDPGPEGTVHTALESWKLGG